MTITILGRQPAIGLAELESLYGADAVRSVHSGIATVDTDIDFDRLGGVVKSAIHLATIESTNAQKVFDYARQALPEFIADFPDGKVKLGVSLYGLDLPLHRQNALALSLKKILRDGGRSVRVVPNTEPALTSAQTYHNQLTSELGCELVFIRDGSSTLIGRVSHVQNINEYAERDRDRPKRDTRVGMLPPKLAQTIINLATGEMKSWEKLQAAHHERETRALGGGAEAVNSFHSKAEGQAPPTILDPFCGTGVVLQEALLMGYSAYGTDIDQRMIDYSKVNLEWLKEKYNIENVHYLLEVQDATNGRWGQPFAVACEGYLGTPFANVPASSAFKDSVMTCNLIMKKFLRNIHGQIPAGTRLCIAAPAWFLYGQTHHLPCLDSLGELGYQRTAFTHARDQDLIYHRDDQIVGRELVVISAI